MTKPSAAWTHAQTREQHYYETRAESHESKNESSYAEFHAPLWNGVLGRLKDLTFKADGCYVDVGCGPNPIVAFIESGRKIGVDPLMPFYQKNFVFPDGFEAHEGTIEELAPIEDNQADVIFSMNNIDHINDLSVATKTLRRKLKPDGHLVVSVNIVKSPLATTAAKLFDVYKIIDPTHTYHFHSPEEVAKHLANDFELVRYECIEDLGEEMQAKKNERDQKRKSLKGLVRAGLKFVKNDILLREKLTLLLFKPIAS